MQNQRELIFPKVGWFCLH